MRYEASGERELGLLVDVYDEALGLTYSVEVPVFNVPFTGWEERTPATWMDPPESDGELELDITPEALFELFEEQDDGCLAEDGLVVVETPKTLHAHASEVIAEAEVEWEPYEPYHD